MRKLLILIPMLLGMWQGSFGQEKAEQRWQGLLWEISGNGATEPSYLYGTMHVSSKLAFHLSDSVYLCIKNSDVVALETDPSTWMEDFLDDQSGYDNYYSSYYNYGFYGDAFNLDFPDMEDIAYELKGEHSMTNHMLYRASYYDNSDFEETTYLDLFIYQAGRKWKKVMAALENYDTTMELLDKAYEPDEDEDEEEYYDYWDIYGYGGKSPYEMIEDAYRDGDLDMLDSLGRLTNPSRNYHHYFIEERNKIMANNMDSIIRSGSSLFTAVGAAHLPGDTGVIELMRYMGYDVRPVVYVQTKVGDKLKEKLEETYLEQVHAPQTTSDGVLTANMPGILYQTSNGEHYKEYFYPDMANGSYYYVSRTNHFGMFRGESQDYILQRIDSILFENIPGKILSKKELNRNGVPGLEVNNRTRKGESQRYHIYVTPLEIVVFKMSGTGDYVKNYSEPFFSSIKFNNTGKTGWQTIERPSGVYTLSLPGSSDIRTYDDEAAGDMIKEFMHGIDPQTGNYYLFMLSSLYDYYYIEDDTFELARLTMRFAEQIDYEVTNRVMGQFDGHACIDADLVDEESGLTTYVKIILKGPLYYLLAMQSEGDRDQAYFDSFALLESKYLQPFEAYVDSTYFFTVETLPEEWEEEGTSNDYYYYYWDEDEGDNSYKSDYGSKTFRSDSTFEEIEVYYYKYHDYYSVREDDDYWGDMADNKEWEEGGGVVVHYEVDSMAIVPWTYTIFGDSGSADQIHLKTMLQEGVTYTISYATDSISGLSEYAKTFFNTFKPLPDTLIGCNIFESRADHFFQYATCADSVLVVQALNSMYEVDFREEHIPQLQQLLVSLDYDKYGMHYRPDIIRELGFIDSESLLPYLEEMYKQVEDTATLQMEILRALGHQNKEEAYDLMLELLRYDTPLTTDDYDITNVFYSIADSLELAARLYPDILDFTYFDEYQGEVLDLLATMLDSGTVEPGLYEENVSALALEAGYELKRLRASEEDEFNSYNYDYNYYSSYSYIDPYRRKSALENYITILAPYHEDPPVAKLFEKLMHVKDVNLKFTAAKKMVEYDIPGSDTIWTNYVEQDEYRLSILEMLEELDRLDLIGDSSYTQLVVAQAQALSGYSYGEEPDSIIFVRKQYVRNAEDEGYIYFFKYQSGPKWNMAHSSIQPMDTTTFELENLYSIRDISYVGEDELQEEMDDVLDYFYIIGRERAQSGKIDDDDYYGYYGWYY